MSAHATEASLYAALTARPLPRGAPEPAELVEDLAAATRLLAQSLSQAGEEIFDLADELPGRTRYRLRGLLLRLEQAAARQQAAASALALHLARQPAA
jgi:hypothetical protein